MFIIDNEKLALDTAIAMLKMSRDHEAKLMARTILNYEVAAARKCARRWEAVTHGVEVLMNRSERYMQIRRTKEIE